LSIERLFSEPTEESVKSMLRSPYKGKAASTELEANKFYMLALSGSGGRAVVRDWIETSLEEAQNHLREYFIGQYVTGGREPYQKLMGLAGATVRDMKELAPWIPLALAEHALKGTPLPVSLLTTAVRRCAIGKINMGTRKREHVNAQQAALIKLCLRSWNREHGINPAEDWMVKLDIQCEEPAYLYGRLFNVLEQIQEGATGGDSVERTFGTAVMSPVSTLPRLIARCNVHLRKLKRDKPGQAVNLGKLMNEIQSKITTEHAFLTRLNAQQQGMFVLGYWHQNAARYEKHSSDETTSNQS
jgi:CRISPR-associated protein Csd1